MAEVTAVRRSRARFAAIAFGVVVIGIAGYAGFVAFVGSDRDIAAGVMVLAAGTGFAAFFSPCSFPLLLTFLTRRATDSRGGALLSGLRVAAGATLLLAAVATVMVLGGTALGGVIEFDTAAGRLFRLGVGLVLMVLGLRQARLWGVRMRWLDRVAGPSARVFDPGRVTNPGRSDVVYGFGYLLAGFG